METCPKKDTCMNKDKSCFKCYGLSFYKPKEQKRKEKKIHKEDQSWKQLEEDVAYDLNNVKPFCETKRQIASGALWYAPGDVDDPIAFFECKERTPTEANGSKSFSLKRNWLEKAKAESKTEGKPMFLPFRFKGDKDIWVTTTWEDISELITTIKSLMKELKERENDGL
jgi:hypothetical protein